MINLIIENVGRGVALDVSFSSSRSIPREAFGLGPNVKKTAKTFDIGPFASGIPSLGPGSKRILTWGQHGGLDAAIGDGTIDITARYRSKPPMSFGWKTHATTSRIDIKSFEQSETADLNWDRKTSEHLEIIRKILTELAGAYPNALRVEIVDRGEPNNSDESVS